jgi:transcriptional regulator with XRE-family HTH domain
MTATTETIRAAIRARIDQGESINRIARLAGYDHSQISRFLHRKRELTTGPKLDHLVRVLGLTVKGECDG